jgi:hypothetical protein
LDETIEHCSRLLKAAIAPGGLLMTVPVFTLDELQGTSLEELLQRVLREQLLLKIRLADGQVVQIQPEPTLRPLPVFEGSVPAHWKDAIYG